MWGLGLVFGNKLCFTRDIPEVNWIPKSMLAPVEPALKVGPKPSPLETQSMSHFSGKKRLFRLYATHEQEWGGNLHYLGQILWRFF